MNFLARESHLCRNYSMKVLNHHSSKVGVRKNNPAFLGHRGLTIMLRYKTPYYSISVKTLNSYEQRSLYPYNTEIRRQLQMQLLETQEGIPVKLSLSDE